MKIKSFKLESGGLSGASIEYNVNDLIDNSSYDSPIKKRCKAPVPQNLKDQIRSLKVFFLDICGYWNKEWDDYIDYENLVVIRQDKPTSAFAFGFTWEPRIRNNDIYVVIGPLVIEYTYYKTTPNTL